MLIGGRDILQGVSNNCIALYSLRCPQQCMIFIIEYNLIWLYLEKFIHERHAFKITSNVNHVVSDKKWEIIHGASCIIVSKVSANSKLTIFLHNRDDVANPSWCCSSRIKLQSTINFNGLLHMQFKFTLILFNQFW